MALDQRQIQKPAQKLRRLLKKMSSAPTPEEVHSFRTNARRLETVLETFGLDDTKRRRRLFKRISQLRRRAGKVRDLDVLTSYVMDVDRDPEEEECSIRLLEHLGARRQKQATKLHKLQQRHSTALRRNLKRTSKAIENIFPPKGDGQLHGDRISSTVAASALTLLSDLNKPPHLQKNNLHEYRLKVKEVRNLLQMAQDSDHQSFVHRLGEVKDAIGEWHDWEVLVDTARTTIDHSGNCRLLGVLQTTTKNKYSKALDLAETMRHQYLSQRDSRATTRSRPHSSVRQIWSAAAALTNLR
jgi:CHAD domain-containing protein